MPRMFEVYVNVVNVTKPKDKDKDKDKPTYLISVDPEQVFLDGDDSSAIVITMRPESLGELKSKDDLQFATPQGEARFPCGQRIYDEPKEGEHRGRITALVNGYEENRTVYTYYIDSHLPEGIIVRVDPEADNPPPPPTGP